MAAPSSPELPQIPCRWAPSAPRAAQLLPAADGEEAEQLILEHRPDIIFTDIKMQKMDGLHVADAIDEIFVLLRRANKYIDETTPWVLAKDPAKADRLGTVLYNLLEAIRFAAIMLEAYLPDTAT